MAEPAHRGSRGRGRSPRPGTAPRSRDLGAGLVSGPLAVATARPAAPPAPDPAAQLMTRTTYRLLLTRGFAPGEAANLTAFLCGIPIGEVRWSLRQVNELLFLRELARSGRFGPSDGGPPRPH